ncbi:hypothetical protein KGM_212453 [Danaus plexippus plexippus]|uniref:Uncharacterized protein n=1 Tax=Danaus plexippus plexippus TaxID=278856 RepID=A0A212EZK3_DANPL|nr:hypothetical protein KGM_212453 [Danaus plexippus plexippus]
MFGVLMKRWKPKRAGLGNLSNFSEVKQISLRENPAPQTKNTKLSNGILSELAMVAVGVIPRLTAPLNLGVAMDGKPFNKSSSNQNGTYDVPKNQNKAKSPIYANYEKPEAQPVYSNINFHDTKNILHKVENPAAKISGKHLIISHSFFNKPGCYYE